METVSVKGFIVPAPAAMSAPSSNFLLRRSWQATCRRVNVAVAMPVALQWGALWFQSVTHPAEQQPMCCSAIATSQEVSLNRMALADKRGTAAYLKVTVAVSRKVRPFTTALMTAVPGSFELTLPRAAPSRLVFGGCSILSLCRLETKVTCASGTGLL